VSLLFLLFSSKRTSRLRHKKTIGQLMLSKKGKVPQKFMPKKPQLIYRDPAAVQSRDISSNSQKAANDLANFEIIRYNAI
jgi:hypothetical protein